MTTIKAVEKIVRSLTGHGDIVVTSLDTGGSSDAGVAETYLDDAIRIIQSELQIEENLYRAESWIPEEVVRFTPSVLTGHAYTHSTRLITEAGAFANYTWRRKDRYHIVSGTGVTADQWVEVQEKVSNDAIRLAAVPAGASTNQTDWVTDGIGYEYGIEFDANTLGIKRAIETHDPIVLQGLYAFNRRTNDYDFGSATPVLVDRTVQLGFDALPVHIQTQIVARAMVEFQRRRQGDAAKDAMLNAEKVESRAAYEAMRTPPSDPPRPPTVGSPFQAPQQRG
jgi:hypothetical protein